MSLAAPAATGDTAIRVTDVRKSYGSRQILLGVSFEVARRDIRSSRA